MNWEDRNDGGSVGTAWVGDTQVTYVISRHQDPLSDQLGGLYVVTRKVAGTRGFTVVGHFKDPLRGQAQADSDFNQLQHKGF